MGLVFLNSDPESPSLLLLLGHPLLSFLWLLFPTLPLSCVSSSFGHLLSLQTLFSLSDLALCWLHLSPKTCDLSPSHLLNCSHIFLTICWTSPVGHSTVVSNHTCPKLISLSTPSCFPWQAPPPFSLNSITSHSEIPIETLESPLTLPSPSSRSVLTLMSPLNLFPFHLYHRCHRLGFQHLFVTTVLLTGSPSLRCPSLYKPETILWTQIWFGKYCWYLVTCAWDWAYNSKYDQ